MGQLFSRARCVARNGERAGVRVRTPIVDPLQQLDWLPKVISEMVGGALLGAAANRQVCPTISE